MEIVKAKHTERLIIKPTAYESIRGEKLPNRRLIGEAIFKREVKPIPIATGLKII